jgi:hypothetical protein
MFGCRKLLMIATYNGDVTMQLMTNEHYIAVSTYSYDFSLR